MRDLHDAVAGFVPPPEARWNVLIPADGEEIIAHHDLGPWNLVVDGPRLALVDWDVAAPGARLWDVAYALHGFLPLSADPAERLQRFADAYGLDEAERLRLVPLLARRTWSMHDFLRGQAGRGVEPWSTLWREGHGRAWAGDAAWTEQRTERWRSALLG